MLKYFNQVERYETFQEQGIISSELSTEISTLQDIFQAKYIESEIIRKELEDRDETNVWLSNRDVSAMKQILQPQVVNNSLNYENLLLLMLNFAEILKSTDYDFAATACEDCYNEYENKSKHKDSNSLAFGSDIDLAFASATAVRLSAADISLSKKEAQSKLSTADFKLWKKAQKSLKKQPSSFEDS